MKTLRLAISRILTYFSENKTIFVLYFIGTISCVIMMIYYYGNTLSYMTNKSYINEIEFRKYHVAFSSPAKVTEDTIEKLKEFEQKYGIQDIELTTIVDSDGNNIEFSSNDEAINDYWLKKLGNHDSSDTDKNILYLVHILIIMRIIHFLIQKDACLPTKSFLKMLPQCHWVKLRA